MEELPIPLSRTDLYLAKAAGMAGVTLPDEPLSREEQFLAVIAGDTSVELPAPASLTELWLAYVAGIEPSPLPALEGAFWVGQQKVDVRYFAVAAGMVGATLPPAPQNRTEQYWAKIAEVLPVHGVLKYATGTIISLTDVVKGIDELQFVYGDTAQQTYTGKNLFDISKVVTSTQIMNNNDGTLTIKTPSGSSTASATAPNKLSDYCPGLKVGDAATLSFTTTGNEKYIYLYGTGANILWGTSAGSKTQTITQAMLDALVLWYASGPSTTATISDIQIELGSTATAYEPYVGGVPAPNPSYPQDVNVVTGEQTVEIVGKNLFDKNNVNGGTYYIDGNQHKIIYGASTYSCYIPIEAGATYTVSKMVTSRFSIATTQETPDVDVTTADNVAGNSATSLTLTASAGAKYLVAYFYRAQSDTMSIADIEATIQIERGSTATDYEPYEGHSYNVDLGSIELAKIGTYQDYIYKSGSDWYVHKACNKYTFTGDESFTRSGYTSTNAFVMYWSTAALDAAYLSDDGYCEFGEVRSFTSMNATSNGVIYNQFNSATSFVKMQKTLIANWDESATDTQKVTLAKAMIIGKSFYYVLTTPTDTKITDATLIAELNAIDSATLPKPDANIIITATSPNLPASIKISYYGEEE